VFDGISAVYLHLVTCIGWTVRVSNIGEVKKFSLLRIRPEQPWGPSRSL